MVLILFFLQLVHYIFSIDTCIRVTVLSAWYHKSLVLCCLSDSKPDHSLCFHCVSQPTAFQNRTEQQICSEHRSYVTKTPFSNVHTAQLTGSICSKLDVPPFNFNSRVSSQHTLRFIFCQFCLSCSDGMLCVYGRNKKNIYMFTNLNPKGI